MGPLLTLAKNALSLFSAKAIDIVCRFLAVAIITRYLGVEQYGEYVFVHTFVLFFVLFSNMGVEEIVTREVAKSTNEAGKYLTGAITIRLVLIPLLVAFYIAIASCFNASEIVLRAIYISMAAQICISFINLFFSVFRGMEKMEYEPLVGLLINLMLLPAIIVIGHFDLGFVSLFNAYLLAHLMAMGILFMIITRKVKAYRPCLDLRLGWDLIRGGYPLGISALIFAGSFHVDIFVLRYLRDPAEVALFQLPFQIIFRLLIIPMSLVTAAFPAISRLAMGAGSNISDLKRSVIQGYKLLLLTGMVTALLLINHSHQLIYLMGGLQFSNAVIALQILAWSTIFLFADFLQSLTLVALNKQRLLVVQNAVSLVVNFILAIVLIPLFGYIGACLATLSTFAVRFVVGFVFVDRSVGGIPAYPMALKMALPGLFAGIFMLLFSSFNAVLTSLAGILLFLLAIVGTKCFSIEELHVFRRMMKT